MKKLCILLALLLGLCALAACKKTPPVIPTTAATTEPAIITTAALAAADAYAPILEEYARLVQTLRDGEPDYDEWEALGFVEVSYFEYKEGALGYAVKDINGDGIPELLLLENDSWGNPGEPAINSLFTLKDGKPVNIGQYWSRHRGHLAADGTIYTVGSSSAWSTYLDSYALEPGAAELTHLTEYYTDIDDQENQFWVRVVDGAQENITEAEFDALVPKYEEPANLMKLDFIPIG